MDMFSVASPALMALLGRLGLPAVCNRPEVLGPGGSGAVVVCNHVGWADSFWLGYALYPRQLRYLSKHELFEAPLAKWVLEQGGCIPIDRAHPTVGSIKTAVELLRQGEVILVFPSGTRRQENTVFRRGAATMALHAQVPIVPVFYRGPKTFQFTHFVERPVIEVVFGEAIPTMGLGTDKTIATALTDRLQTAIEALSLSERTHRVAA